MDLFTRYDYILVSQSPRRRQLLDSLGLKYRLADSSACEIYPPDLQREEIPLYLSRQKAENCKVSPITDRSLIIAADTIVWARGNALGKPRSKGEASRMLQSLAGGVHEVITGVTLRSLKHQVQFCEVSRVVFSELTDEEINYYVEYYTPLDKAGAYGIQEWIGMMGVKRIEGCFYNIMGLPLNHLYEELKKWNE